MKVGDLVRCSTVDGNPIGLIVSEHKRRGMWKVSIPGKYQGVPFAFQEFQLKVINESR